MVQGPPEKIPATVFVSFRSELGANERHILSDLSQLKRKQ